MFSIFHSNFLDDSHSVASNTDAELCKENNEEIECKRDFSAESQTNRFSRFSHSLDASESPSTTENLTAEFLEKCAESPANEMKIPNLHKDFEFKSKSNAERLGSNNSVRKKMMIDHESQSQFTSNVQNLNIITSREQIDFMTNECVTKNLAERDKILTLKNRTLGSDICKRRFENLCFQQKEFDEFVGSLKTDFFSKQRVLDSGCTESVLKIVQKECDLFKQFFPAYGFRRKILNTVAKSQVTIISADSAYFCNIAVPILLSNNEYYKHSIFACESNEVLSQILKEKIYHVTSKQTANDQQIFVFSEKLLLDHLCYTSFFCDTSFCITLNLSLKRSIIADILLANILDLLVSCTNSKLILLLSHYDSVSKYEMYFSQKLTVSSLTLPSLVFPVKTMWKTVPSSSNDNFIDDVVQTVFAIHTLCEPGDIITFLSSNEDIKCCFGALDAKLDYYQYDDLKVFKIGEDSDENDIQTVFSHSPVRKVFLVPSGYDGLIIPSVLYVIDCGIKKEFCFDSKSDINVTLSSFISHATAKVRKELAGVCNIGTCFRLYNKVNYTKDMYLKEHAEVFCINPMHSMVKIFQHRPNIMGAVQFVESLPNDIQVNTIKLLRDCGAIDKNSHLTPFGEKLIKLPFSSKYSRFILSGLVWGFAYEAIILVAFFLVRKTIKDVFMELKDEECQKLIDTVKLEFNQLDSDTLTFLNIYKTWKKNGFKKLWCEKNYINYITLKYVRAKVNDIRHIVNECLGENIAEEISEIKDEQDLIQMLFECFQDNLCVFTGHHRIGYQILSSRQLALVHSSSILFGKENPPQFVIYDKLLCTNGYFLSNLTSIPFEFIMEKLQNNSINFSSSELLEEKLIKRVIEPVGEKVITQVLLKNEGRKIREIEERIKKKSSAKVVLIEPVLGKGCVTVYAFHPYIDTCFSILEEILKNSTKSIMNEEETRIVYLKNGNSVPVEILWSKGANIQTAKHLLYGIEVVNNPRLLSVVERDLESVNTSSINYTLKLFIPRRICTGEGFINFNNKKDFDRARRLTLQYISINKTEAQVFVQVSNIKEYQLHVLDILPEVSREDLIESFSNLLPEVEFDIELCYLPPFNTTEKELLQIKRQIEINCKNYTNLVNFEVKVSKPEPSSTYTYAFVNVFEERCLDKEARNLSARKINKMNISCKPLYFSKVKCNPEIYEALKYRIKEEFTMFEQEHIKNYEEKYFKVEPKICEDVVTVQLSSNDVEIMKDLQMSINCLLDGVKLSKNNFKQINKLFCHGGHVFLKTLEKTFNICIVKNFETKTVRLFGLQKNCNDAIQSIIGFVEDAMNEIVRSIILSSERGNRLLLKEIIMKYGPNLEKFIELHGLRTAALDIRTSCLLLYGKKDNIDKAEECVNELSTSIDLPSICSDSSSEEICPVCLCPAENLTYRLELCGHLYCSACIKGLIEQDKFPIQCSAENCSQDVILGDIKYVLDDEDEKMQELAGKSMKNFLERNQNKLFHCPAADCAMFIFKTEVTGDKWKCPLCQNFICVKCNVVFHDGYSCDMYQGSKLDPDYSLKVWEETSKKGKRCPKCSIPIEKRSGCNHMTCEKCSCHFCWLCGSAFPTGNDVYAHINRAHTGQLFVE